MSKYIIESIGHFPNKMYWNGHGPVLGWTPCRADATEFTQARRDNGGLPNGGCWVVLDEPEHLWHFTLPDWKRRCGNDDPNSKSTSVAANVTCPDCLRLMSGRHNFTVIKLRPVAIRLSVTEGDYDDLDAQALEFEAALRLWVKNQQILTDGWAVDVIDED